MDNRKLSITCIADADDKISIIFNKEYGFVNIQICDGDSVVLDKKQQLALAADLFANATEQKQKEKNNE